MYSFIDKGIIEHMKKSKTNKNKRTKRDHGAFSKKSRMGAKTKKQNIKRHTKPAETKDNKNISKSPIEAELGMRICGVCYKMKNGRGAAKYYVIPSSRRVGFDICVTNATELSEGELCEVVLTKLPDRAHNTALGRLSKVFGAADSKDANYASILSACGIATEFPLSVIEEADDVCRQEISPEGRADLRDELIFTLDGADAKDLDDAISLRVTDDGWELGVHIADVSHYVRENSELDREAMWRGTSVYFTDKVVPMLPSALSNGACSLNFGEDKYAMSATVMLDKNAKLVGTKVEKSIIRSCLRGVYSEANDVLALGEGSQFYEKYKHVYPTLCEMYRLFKKREKIAEVRGYVELESNESKIILDEAGDVVDIRRFDRGESERLIEQFMLLANEGVARYMSSLKIPCVYRIHESPDEEKVRNFVNFCSNYALDITPLTASGVSAVSYQKILDEAKEKDIADIVSGSMLRSFMKARYSEIRLPHFGLALDYYAHFTSPIRRYPDLAVHRILSEALNSYPDKAKKYSSYAREAAVRSSENELRALNAERAIEDLYKTIYMKGQIDKEFEAKIISVQSFGFFATLENTCEGLVPVASLDGFYVYNEQKNTLASKRMIFSVGDIVKIKVKYADTVRRRVEFEFIEMIEKRAAE